MRLLLSRPTYLLSALWLLCLAMCAGSAWFAINEPSLGMAFGVREGQVVVERITAPQAADIQPGARALRLNEVEIVPGDLNNDPDMTLNFEEFVAFYAKLDKLNAEMHEQTVTFTWLDAQNVAHETVIQPRPRQLHDLPPVFWLIWFVGSVCLLISVWVYVLKPRDWGAAMFALSGLMLMVSAAPTAVIYSRELAISADLFRLMMLTNHFGAPMYGMAIAAMFLCYPKRLIRPRHILWMALIATATFIAEIAQIGSAKNSVVTMSVAMLITVIAAVVQWRLTRQQPLERASLRWFFLATLIGLTLLTVTLILPPLFGALPLMSTGYAFGFFLIIYIGIALGLRKYRLFDLDEWAYRIFLWIAGATAVIAMDVALMTFGIGQTASLSATLLLCGGLYFPFRQWLWQRIVNKQSPNFESLLPELSAIAFTTSAQEQQARWSALLKRVFDPLEMKPCAEPEGAGISNDGLHMRVPSCGALPSYALRYAGHGSRLFSTHDAVFAASLAHLLEQVMSGRNGYEQGVAQERLRIGRDLHDNIGARLLKLIHHLRGTPSAEVARDAMKDLRTAIASMDTRPVPLGNALADWRAEADSRCEVAGCRLQWQQNEALPPIELAPRMKATLESVMREIITNALKHAAPHNINVDITTNAARLRARVANDGAIADPLTWKDGYGLRNIRGRLEELGGNLSISCAEDTVRLTLEVPLT
jgi:signal transduction histidine kinase